MPNNTPNILYTKNFILFVLMVVVAGGWGVGGGSEASYYALYLYNLYSRTRRATKSCENNTVRFQGWKVRYLYGMYIYKV